MSFIDTNTQYNYEIDSIKYRHMNIQMCFTQKGSEWTLEQRGTH
jgi:hypothetical protein